MAPIAPHSEKVLNCCHQKLSWKITKADWSSDESVIFFKLQTKIPGSSSIGNQVNGFINPHLGGFVYIDRERKCIGFMTQWPKDVELNNISVEAVFTIRLEDGSSVDINCGKFKRFEGNTCYHLRASIKVALDPELIFDEEGCFIIEAELKVAQGEPNKIKENSRKSDFVKDIGAIFSEKTTSDVVVIAGEEMFHCHKNILSARCEVLKNMIAPNTVESESNTIEVREAPAEAAVESMLKCFYTGEVPNDPKKLTLDLLNLAEMHLLDHLKETCVKSLMERLDVSSCISTFIKSDRYVLSGGYLKKMVMKFMKCKAEEVVELEDWDKLSNNHPDLAKEVLRSIVKGVKEKHKCQFCVISYGD